METKTNTNQNPDKSRKVIRIVISILVAIALWVYVDRGLSVEVTMKVNNVPVEFSGEDTSLAEKNLMLLSGYDTTIDLVLKGPRSELFKLDKSKVRIVADTSTIQETGQQTLSYQVYFQDDIQRSKISVDHASAYSVTVTVGEMDSKTVPIRCDVVGSTAKGFTAGELTLDPAELNLRGQRDDLLNIAYAKVTLDISGADRTVVQALEWELYDYNDIKIDNPAVRSKVKTVQATLPVKTSKEVDLVVNFVPAAGSTLDTMQYTVSPDKVTLVGEKDVLDTIDAIVLDTLYLQDLQPSQSLTYSVTAPEGTTLAENVGPVRDHRGHGGHGAQCHRDGLQLRKRAGGLLRRAGDREPEHPPAGPGERDGPDHRRGPAHYRGPQRYHGAGGPHGAGDGAGGQLRQRGRQGLVSDRGGRGASAVTEIFPKRKD